MPDRPDPRNGGESAGTERVRLAEELEASGHGGCAFDLTSADDIDVVDIAYQVADHVEEACGDADFAANPGLAQRIREWANKLSRVDPSVARKGKIPVTVHRQGSQVFVDVHYSDLLDLSRDGDERVTLSLDGQPLMSFDRIQEVTVSTPRNPLGPLQVHEFEQDPDKHWNACRFCGLDSRNPVHQDGAGTL